MPLGWVFDFVDCETFGNATAVEDQATASATITIGPLGGAVDCVFVNTALASITIMQTATDGNGAENGPNGDAMDETSDAQLSVQQVPPGNHGFGFVGPGGPFTLTLNTPQTAQNQQSFTLPPGTHNFAQVTQPPGWTLSPPVQCLSSISGPFAPAGPALSLNLAPLESISCTFANTAPAAGGPGAGPGGPGPGPGGPGGGPGGPGPGPGGPGPGGPGAGPGGPGPGTGGPPDGGAPGPTPPPPVGLPATGSGGLTEGSGTPAAEILLISLLVGVLASAGVGLSRRRR
ncbi:MAG: hypothetical protein DK306_001721 [Chloroflexi bacterium]|nr:MAG: hypothetical protein DK306_001721 [Chloroflexota bacterium]